MRADAAARRVRLVQAARRLAAQHGADVPLDKVAAAAEVGIATLYRNFPGRPELMDAVALAVVEDVVAAGCRAAEALDAAADDAEQGTETAAWSDLVRELLALDLGALSEALDAHRRQDVGGEVLQARDGAVEVLGDVVGRLQRGGVVRADLTVPELVTAIGVITRPQPGGAPGEADPVVTRLGEAYLAWTLAAD